MKKCATCKELKTLDRFNNAKRYKDGLYFRCKDCCRKQQNSNYAKNPEKYRLKAKLWRDSNKDKHRSALRRCELKRKYKITPEIYARLLSDQNGVCAICSKAQDSFQKVFAVDHSHSTGRIRGLLCSRCNTSLGLIRENHSVALKMAEYIIKHTGSHETISPQPEEREKNRV